MQDLGTRSDWEDLQPLRCADQALMDQITSAPKQSGPQTLQNPSGERVVNQNGPILTMVAHRMDCPP